MLENLFGLVKEFGQEQVVANPDIPNEHNEAVMAEASNAVAGTLQNELAKGNLQGVLGMFNSDHASEVMSSPVAQNMQAGFMDNIISKLGINKQVAAGLAATLIPMVISKFVKRTRSTASEDAGFDLNSILNGLSGGSGIDFGGLLKQFGGGQSNGGGLDDILAKVKNGASQQQKNDGLGGLIGGLFGS